MSDEVDQTFGVKCDGEIHRVTIRAGGRIDLHDHPRGYCRSVVTAKIAARGVTLNGCDRVIYYLRCSITYNTVDFAYGDEKQVQARVKRAVNLHWERRQQR